MAWQLPPGIEDLLPPQAAALEGVRARVLALLGAWGYELVIPPLIEYADALLTGTGADLGVQTFRLTDPLTGAQLGVRADMTPQVARIDARHGGEGVRRLCYLGSVLTTAMPAPGAVRNPVQLGAELYGHAGVDADVEVVRLLLAVLEVTRAGPMQLDLGHVGIYRALAQAAGLDADTEHALFGLLQRKAVPDMHALLDAAGVDHEAHGWLAALPTLYGDHAVLDEAGIRFAGAPAPVRAALDELRAIATRLGDCAPAARLSFDLAELRGYGYHTGAVFAAYLPGQGQAIARGGRYDGIGRVFGRDRPATGFSVELNKLVPAAGARVAPVAAPADTDPALLDFIATLRAQGRAVVQLLEGEAHAGPRIERHGGAWRVRD